MRVDTQEDENRPLGCPRTLSRRLRLSAGKVHREGPTWAARQLEPDQCPPAVRDPGLDVAHGKCYLPLILRKSCHRSPAVMCQAERAGRLVRACWVVGADVRASSRDLSVPRSGRPMAGARRANKWLTWTENSRACCARAWSVSRLQLPGRRSTGIGAVFAVEPFRLLTCRRQGGNSCPGGERPPWPRPR
jgi:hypothetical protein